jgi:hypothetical protein
LDIRLLSEHACPTLNHRVENSHGCIQPRLFSATFSRLCSFRPRISFAGSEHVCQTENRYGCIQPRLFSATAVFSHGCIQPRLRGFVALDREFDSRAVSTFVRLKTVMAVFSHGCFQPRFRGFVALDREFDTRAVSTFVRLKTIMAVFSHVYVLFSRVYAAL